MNIYWTWNIYFNMVVNFPTGPLSEYCGKSLFFLLSWMILCLWECKLYNYCRRMIWMTSMDFLFFFVAQDFVIDEALDMDLERYLGDGKMWVGVRTSWMWEGGKGVCKRGGFNWYFVNFLCHLCESIKSLLIKA